MQTDQRSKKKPSQGKAVPLFREEGETWELPSVKGSWNTLNSACSLSGGSREAQEGAQGWTPGIPCRSHQDQDVREGCLECLHHLEGQVSGILSWGQGNNLGILLLWFSSTLMFGSSLREESQCKTRLEIVAKMKSLPPPTAYVSTGRDSEGFGGH